MSCPITHHSDSSPGGRREGGNSPNNKPCAAPGLKTSIDFEHFGLKLGFFLPACLK